MSPGKSKKTLLTTARQMRELSRRQPYKELKTMSVAFVPDKNQLTQY
jgi:hypothetical protein